MFNDNEPNERQTKRSRLHEISMCQDELSRTMHQMNEQAFQFNQLAGLKAKEVCELNRKVRLKSEQLRLQRQFIHLQNQELHALIEAELK